MSSLEIFIFCSSWCIVEAVLCTHCFSSEPQGNILHFVSTADFQQLCLGTHDDEAFMKGGIIQLLEVLHLDQISLSQVDGQTGEALVE